MIAAWWLRRQRRLGGKPRFRVLRFRFLRFLIKPQAVRFLRFRFGFHGSGSVCGFPAVPTVMQLFSLRAPAEAFWPRVPGRLTPAKEILKDVLLKLLMIFDDFWRFLKISGDF